MQQAPRAIIFAALRRFRGPALFHGLRTSSRLGAPFWPSGLTLRSSGLAFSQPLILAVSPITRSMRAATYFSAPPCSKGFQAFWASSACAASATSYPSCSAAPLPWPSGFSWLRLVALRWFLVFLASDPCVASASSYCFRSAAQPRWRSAFSQFVPVAKSKLPVLASGSNISVKPTRLRRSAYLAR